MSSTGVVLAARLRLLLRVAGGRRMARLAMVAMLILSLAAVAVTFAAFSGTLPFVLDPDLMLILIYLDLGLLLLLGIAVARRIVAVWAARRRGAAGSRLHVRLAMLFGALAVGPALMVAVFSLIFFDFGLESWFSERVRTALGESREVAEAYYREHRNNIRADALRIARDLDNESQIIENNETFLQQILQIQLNVRDLSEAIIFEGATGQVLARAGLTFVLEFEPISELAIADAGQGEVVTMASDADDRMRALIKLDNFIDTYLYIGRLVDPKVLARVERTLGAVQQFDLLESRRSDFQLSFALGFAVVAFLILLTAIWIGLVFATALSRSVGDLIAATERIRAGDLSAALPEEDTRDDEVGMLSRAFNRMTEQLRTQRAELLEANRIIDDRRRFTEAVLFGVSAGVIGLDAQARIELPNRRASALLGRDLEADIGKSLNTVFPEVRPLLSEAEKKRGDGFVNATLRLARAEGEMVLLAGVGAERAEGTITGFVVTFDDITDLESAQRKAAWADAARRIAHEIKNPLTPIQISAERLKRKYLDEIASDPETFRVCADTIIRHVEDIGRMVDEFSSFARMPASQPALHDLAEITRKAVFLQRNAHDYLQYKTKIPNRSIMLWCDPRHVGQALTNLLQNAYDAIMDDAPDAGGADAADVADGPSAGKGRIGVGITRRGGKISLTITDNGKGLPGGDRERLTEAYVTGRAGGTGLGLAIVRKVMEDHGGCVILNDQPRGRGAVVTLEFPDGAAQDQASEVPAGEAKAEAEADADGEKGAPDEGRF